MSQIAYDKAQPGSGPAFQDRRAVSQPVQNSSIPHGREVGHDPQAAPHALFVNFGTAPHRILPKKERPSLGRRWRVPLRQMGQPPGYRGDNYMQAAADAAIRQFRAHRHAAMKEQA